MPDSPGPVGVLVVDDDTGVLRMLQHALVAQGFVVSVAASGREAVEVLRRPAADVRVAVLDVLMPDMDGLATLHALRAVRPGLPVCFYTAFAGKYSEAQLLAPGRCRLLIKPAPIDQLTKNVRALAQANGDGEAPPAGGKG